MSEREDTMKLTPYALACLLLVTTACSSVMAPSFIPAAYTQQDVGRVSNVGLGMDKAAVKEIMGSNPARIEFSTTVEAWHYCKTDSLTNEFAVVVFKNGQTTQAKNYSIKVPADTTKYEDCSKFIRSIFR